MTEQTSIIYKTENDLFRNKVEIVEPLSTVSQVEPLSNITVNITTIAPTVNWDMFFGMTSDKVRGSEIINILLENGSYLEI